MSFLRSLFNSKSESSSTPTSAKKPKTGKKKITASAPTTPLSHEHHKKPAFDAELYDSQEHADFCKKWHVHGELTDYPFWTQFINEIEGELNKQNYAKLVYDVRNRFGIATRSNLLLTNRPSESIENVPVISKDERTIWTYKNIRKLLLELNLDDTSHRFDALYAQFIKPLIEAIDKLHFNHDDLHKRTLIKQGDEIAIRDELKLAFAVKYHEENNKEKATSPINPNRKGM